MYKIEKGIEIPAITHSNGIDSIPDILSKMESGDSVKVALKQATYWATLGRKRFNYKMVSRKLSDSTARVWRVE